MNVGACLRERRLAAGWNQSQMGNLIGKSQQTVSDAECGTMRCCAHIVMAYARVLGFDPKPIIDIIPPKIHYD